jgi:membrane fusion protein, multidrug efflux system
MGNIMNAKRSFLRGALLVSATVVAAVAAVGYFEFAPHASGQAPAGPPPAVPVNVHTLAPEQVRVWSTFSGRLQPVDVAEIRPQVSGRITEVLFEDGQRVKAGDVLLVIDPRPFEAAIARARGNLATSNANIAYAKAEVDRAASLVRTQAVAQRVYDERVNASRVAEASRDVAEADLKQAELDLEHAHVRAPIAGRVSRVEVTLGNLVQSGTNAPLLTTIVANDSIYADFEVDEQTYIQSIRAQGSAREAERRIPVRIQLQEDGERVYEGTIYSFDNRIDVSTGTIRARAKLENADGTLLPGMFVSVRLADAMRHEALLIPERAIGSDQSKRFVYVVNPDNTVGYRAVELGRQVRAHRIALKGVQAGDRVIVDGLQHLRPNSVVKAEEAPPNAVAQAAATSTTR